MRKEPKHVIQRHKFNTYLEIEGTTNVNHLIFNEKKDLSKRSEVDISRIKIDRDFDLEDGKLKINLSVMTHEEWEDKLGFKVPHSYNPSVMHMGDCYACGNMQDHPNHEVNKHDQ